MNPNGGGPGVTNPEPADQTTTAATAKQRDPHQGSASPGAAVGVVVHTLAALLGRLDPARLAAVVSLLPLEQLLAVRVGAEVALDRADHRLAGLLGADFPAGRWHRSHPLPEHTELQLARWPPTGDRDLWIRYGPAGPPPGSAPKKVA